MSQMSVQRTKLRYKSEIEDQTEVQATLYHKRFLPGK